MNWKYSVKNIMALDSSKTLFPAALPIAKKAKPNLIKPNLVTKQ